jgi:hypothetical protein
VYSWVAVTLMALRFLVALLQFTAAWGLFNRHPLGGVLGLWSFLASAGLLTLELGLRLAPTSLFPTYRWPAVLLYWIYAVSGAYACAIVKRRTLCRGRERRPSRKMRLT